MRRKFRLLKDTPEIKAGAILEEKCDNGDQDFCVIEGELKVKNPSREPSGRELNDLVYWRGFVINQPDWFEEIVPFYVPKGLVKKVEKFINGLK